MPARGPRMRITILVLTGWLLSAGLAAAQSVESQPTGTRPRIGLVLSGGGARGTAHIGVLKVLEELHVPIDAIAGTSMGAVVGGLYASGMSAVEIEKLLSTVDWQDAFRDRPKRAELAFRRKREDEDFLVNLPLGLRGKKLLIPTGLIAGQKLTQVLRQATLPTAKIDDFDRLATPLRVVATDLESGAAVIIKSGDLPTALRASMSAPGVFSPVERDGRMLVDGGLVKNLPIDVARSMGVDILIVVDAGLPLQSRDQLTSLTSVSNQSVAIMVHRDADQQRATLGSRDVLLQPVLEDVSSYDFRVITRAVAAGAAAARAAETPLTQYAIDASSYTQYLAHRQTARSSLPAVQFVRTDAASSDYQRAVTDLFGDQVGAPLNVPALEKRVTTLYGRGIFETLDYRLVRATPSASEAAPDYGLEFSAHRNTWGPNYLRLGLSLQDDFAGNTSFNAAGRLLFTELNTLGAEWVLDLQVGAAPHLSTELYLPLSNRTRYFIAPHLQTEAHNIPQLDGTRQIGEYRVRSFEYGLDGGRELGNWGELRGGVLRSEGSARVRLGDFSVADTSFGVDAGFVRFSYDRLDSANFPRSGQTFRLEYRVEGNGRSGAGTDLLTLDWRSAWSRGKNTAVAWLSGGSTVGGSETNVRSYFPLGGFLNLSGLRAQSIAGPHYAIARAIYLHKVGSGGEGVLNVPAYAGLSLEAGNVWSHRDEIRFGSTRKDVSLFFGADTYIGPAYLAAGYDDQGNTAFYLFLGRSF
jgi:NTE family protein